MTFEDCVVVGMHFRAEGAKQIAASLRPGDSVTLKRDPYNNHDENAIEVYVEDFHIGYIERADAAWIAPHADLDDAELTAEVTGHVQRKTNIHPVLTITVNEPA